uniref:Uncharacterized protein n=1 Tax=Auxenochlorella protothecoides TaxID=3075 RepID=A0A1D1ZUS5_AUXPR
MERSEVTGASGYSEGTTTLLGLSQSSRSQRSALSSLLRRGLAGSLAVALSPWRLLLAWASWWSGLLLSALSYLGATPTGFLPYSKYQELGNIVEHMHSREDAFRTTIRELQDKLDANNQDKRKALRKLKSTLVRVGKCWTGEGGSVHAGLYGDLCKGAIQGAGSHAPPWSDVGAGADAPATW